MGCDIHLTLERCIRKVDQETLRARLLLLCCAKRAERDATDDSHRLPAELWQRCARLVTATTATGDVEKWVACPYAEWLAVSEEAFMATHKIYELKRAAAEEEERAKLHASFKCLAPGNSQYMY
jgi:hypothetical protein